MAKTKIEWATDVWNPTVGCTKVSAGCKNCYAERIFHRFHRWPVYPPYEKFSEVRCYPERLDQPIHWKKPRRIFVDSISDLFHEDVPDNFIREVFWMMQRCGWHIFIILTKRAKRMYQWMTKDPLQPVLPNVWLIVSVENQKAADERITWLLNTPAAVRGVSVEPMLDGINLYQSIQVSGNDGIWDEINAQEDVDGESEPEQFIEECEAECDWVNFGNDLVVNPEWHEWEQTRNNIARFKMMKRDLHWVIVGCESGPGARPMDLDWARSLRDQCQVAGVPFFLKQAMINGKLVKMPELDGKIWAEYPKIDENRA